MKKKIYNKLATKLIFLVVFALLISLLFSSGLLTIVWYIMKSNSYVSLYDVPNYYIYFIIVFFMIPIITFVATFLFGINKRIKYLKYIISKIGSITNEKFIGELDFKGNDEISDLANSINIMSNRLKGNYEKEKKLEKDKNELIVAVSHDLRTPLTSIIGYLDLLKDDKFTYEDVQKDYLNVAYKKSVRLKKIINELFEFTKLTSDISTLEKIPFNIATLVNQVVGEQIPFFSEKNIKVEIESTVQDLYCEIDIQNMVRVIENIVKNAEKYSFPNTNFKVKMMELDDNIIISFENRGENISKEELEKIFEKMYRLDKSRTGEAEGSGLGLAIAKKIIEMHNGKLWAECNDNTIKFNILLQKA
ncbi:HAMP domain-containing histidine kinase [Clostridium estertheticum]|uniref:sensor histidine kinase n=1 Tax=Clostridium estertheticum TaxID=238834 RepID=UPI001C0B1305|nr:HAMP domain-containing sensor histidine kinase [Clostridium estertheticum]MBU3179519.1 HAMP domain-containing histidine kinase [Clostridium estertheticum]